MFVSHYRLKKKDSKMFEDQKPMTLVLLNHFIMNFYVCQSLSDSHYRAKKKIQDNLRKMFEDYKKLLMIVGRK